MRIPFPLATRRAFVAGLGLTALTLPSRASDPPRDLRAAPTPRRLRPDGPAEAAAWTFESAWPGADGPTVVRVRAGQEIRGRLVNDTSRPLSLHWHGVRGPNAADGAGGLTQAPVPPGGRQDIAFTPPDPGTFLIRPCVIGGSAEPAERGLTGLLIVDEAAPPPVDRDVALLVDDWLLGESGDLAPFEAGPPALGRLGNWLTVSGAPTPLRIEAPPGSRLRLRLANACNARAMRLQFENLRPFIAAIDGQPTDTFEPLRASVPFPPGTRYDMLLDLPAEAGATGTVRAAIGDSVPILALTTAGERRAALSDLRPLPPNRALPEEIRLQAAVRRDLVIRAGAAGGPAWTLSGKPGDARSPVASVRKGQPVVLALKNETPLVQPFHVHGHVFRLLHPLDDGWEPYFLDTVQVPENRTVRIAFVADNPGKWLIASTVLERFDAGLWTWFEVS